MINALVYTCYKPGTNPENFQTGIENIIFLGHLIKTKFIAYWYAVTYLNKYFVLKRKKRHISLHIEDELAADRWIRTCFHYVASNFLLLLQLPIYIIGCWRTHVQTNLHIWQCLISPTDFIPVDYLMFLAHDIFYRLIPPISPSKILQN